MLFLRLAGDPVAVRVATEHLDRAEQRLEHARLSALQGPVADAVTAMGVPILYRFTRVANGIQVRATSEQRAALGSLPGVVAVHPVLELSRTLEHTVPHIGVTEALESLGVDGAGVRLGIIDSGVDYLHVAFGGPGTEAAYAASDPTRIDDTLEGTALFPSPRVVGGYDFVGASYLGRDGPLPVPDDDPMPDYATTSSGQPVLLQDDHGTHVAAIAAGSATDSTAPGVAPGADIYALRVVSAGSTSMTGAAIEWAADPDGDGAVDDRLDVLNISLGSPFGGSDRAHKTLEALAVEAFVALGGVIVASAGNAEDIPFIHSAPGALPDVIAVANAHGPGETATRLAVHTPADLTGEYVAKAASTNLAPSLDDTGPVSGELFFASRGCEGADYAAVVVGGVALVERGDCKFAVKIGWAELAGAAAVVTIQNKPGSPTKMTGAPKATVPAVMVPQEIGEALRDAWLAGDDVSVTLGANFAVPELTDTIRSSSSRGPGHAGRDAQTRITLKPDLAAPGAHVVAAHAGTGVGVKSKSGTSMAAPHVAGAAALLRQLHPEWSARAIKAALLNTAIHTVFDAGGHPDAGGVGDPVPLSRQGAGRVDVVAALSTDLVAYGGDQVALDFGALDLSEPASPSRTLTLSNLGATPLTVGLEATVQATVEAAGVSLSSAALELPPGGSADVEVTLTIDPAARLPWRLDNDTTEGSHTEEPDALSEAEIEGVVTVTPAGGGKEPLRVPIYALVRPVAKLTLANTCLAPADFALTVMNGAEGVSGRTEIFTLLDTDTNEDHPHDSVDLRAVGARVHGGLLQVAVATWGWRLHPGRVLIAVFIDVDDDNVAEFVLANIEQGKLEDDDPTGRQEAVLLAPLGDGGATDDSVWLAGRHYDLIDRRYVIGDLLSSTLVLSAPVEELGLNGEGAAVHMWLATWDRAQDIGSSLNADDRMPNEVSLLNLDFSTHGYRFEPGCSDWRFEEMTLLTTSLAESTELVAPPGACGARGVLLLHENAVGLAEAEIVESSPPDPFVICLDAAALEAGDGCAAAVDLHALTQAASCAGDLAFSPNPGPTLVAGTTEAVEYTVLDGWGRTTTCATEITVEDSQPPSLACSGDGAAVEAQDVCEPVVTLEQATCYGATGSALADCDVALVGGELQLVDPEDRVRRVEWRARAQDSQGNTSARDCTVLRPAPPPPAPPPDEGESCLAAASPGSPAAGLWLLLLIALAAGRSHRLGEPAE